LFDVTLCPVCLLAQIAVEIFFCEKTIFSCGKRATNGSSFLCLEKKVLAKKIGTDSWSGFKQKSVKKTSDAQI